MATAAGAVLAALAAWLAPARAARYGALAGSRVALDSSPSPGFTVQRVTLTTTRGRELDCAVRSPIAPPLDARLTGMVIAGGRRTGRRAVLHLDTAFAGVAIACEYPWAELVRRRGARFVAVLPRLRGEMVGTPEAMGVMASHVLTRPGVDSTRLLALGASLGVPFAAAWAGRDARVDAVALAYLGADLAQIFRTNLEGEVPADWMIGPAARLFAWLLAPLEPARTVGAIAPRPLLVTGAADDQWIPPATIEQLFGAARPPKRLAWFHGAHLRTGDAALLAALNDTLRLWLDTVLVR